MRHYRLSRLQQQVSAYDCAGLLLFDPLNIRYATDTTNMQLWIAHNAARACFVPPTGKVILFDFHNCEHLSAHLPLVGEVRAGHHFSILKQATAQMSMQRPLRVKSQISCVNMGATIGGWPWIRLKMQATGAEPLSSYPYETALIV